MSFSLKWPLGDKATPFGRESPSHWSRLVQRLHPQSKSELLCVLKRRPFGHLVEILWGWEMQNAKAT